jgi:hypothetical protein
MTIRNRGRRRLPGAARRRYDRADVRPTAGTGGRAGYASAIAGLWGSLSRTLSILERYAADPDEHLSDPGALDSLPHLQYVLHETGERALAIDPPAGAETAHAELASALAEARDLTAEVHDLVTNDGPGAAHSLLYEWRGALFRVRLARLRLHGRPDSPQLAAAEPDLRPRASLVAMLLVLGGAALLAVGASLALWPIWGAGLALVAASCLVYRV